MLQDTAQQPHADVQGTYTWGVPGGPVRVHLALDVARRLEEYLKQEPVSSLTAAGSISGLLLGEIDSPGSTRILDFRPLGLDTTAEVEAALSEYKSAPKDLRVVGYFRTHEKGHLFLDALDLSLAGKFFNGPASVFLLISSSGKGPRKAGFFFWDRGEINGDFCFREFVFDASALARNGTGETKTDIEDHTTWHSSLPVKIAALAPTRSWILEAASESAFYRRGASLGESQRPKPSRLFWTISTIFAVAMGVNIALVYSGRAFSILAIPPLRGAKANPEYSPLGLQVRNEGEWLLVSWDRRIPAVESATGGVLRIDDGTQHREARLNAHEVARGSLLYRPISGDISLWLELTGRRRSMRESLRILTRSGTSAEISQPKVASQQGRIDPVKAK